MDSSLPMILAAVLGFVVIAGLGFAFAGGGGQGRTLKRAQALSDRKRSETVRRPTGPDPSLRRKQMMRALREQDRQNRKASISLEARLQQAGLEVTVNAFWITCAGVGLFVALIALVMHQKIFVSLGLAFAAGLGLPRWVISMLSKRRAKKFVEAFADATDVIVRGIKSGLPVHECLLVISRESPEPLAGEFRLLVDGVSHGLTMDQALEKMYARMPIQELRFFAIVLGIQQKTGGNLAEALNNLSTVLRARKMMKEKIKALSSEALASAMIIGCMPPAVATLITITTPSYLTILYQTAQGQLLLGAAGFWMGTGIFMMRRMINFKF
jgi:tight adherence protein B